MRQNTSGAIETCEFFATNEKYSVLPIAQMVKRLDLDASKSK